MAGLENNAVPNPDDELSPPTHIHLTPHLLNVDIANRSDPLFLSKISDAIRAIGSGDYRQIQIAPAIRNLLSQCAWIETTNAISNHRTFQNHPVFPSETELHTELSTWLERKQLRIMCDAIGGWADLADARERAFACGFEQSMTADQIYRKISELESKLKSAHRYTLSAPEGAYLRLSAAGFELLPKLEDMSQPARELLFQSVFAAHSSKLFSNTAGATKFLGQIERIVSLGTPERDLRKLYLAICDHTLQHTSLEKWVEEMKVEHAIGDYLGAAHPKARADALEYLRSQSGARYGPPPYFRDDPRYEETIEDARRIVIRARNEAFSFPLLAQETKRLPNGIPSLLQRYCLDAFETVQGVHTTDMNVPPGGGLYFDSPRLNKLFFGTNDRNRGSQLLISSDSWFAPALDYFEDTSFIYIRGDKIAINNDPSFQIDGVPYAYAVINDHQNSSYRHAILLPTKLVIERIRPCLFDLDEGPNQFTQDMSKSYFTVERLSEACLSTQGKVLNLTGVSSLFCGPAYAFPAHSNPHFSWESEPRNMSTLWKDAEGHVHASYRIWAYQGDAEEVHQTLSPLQKLNDEVSRVVNRYQQLLGIFQNRYAAWKNDQVPGKEKPPTMLQEAYRWYWAKRGTEDAPVLCLLDRTDSGGQPQPLIDCKTLELFIDGKAIQLAQGSDGSRSERRIWREQVEPLLFDPTSPIRREGRYELVMMDRKYLHAN